MALARHGGCCLSETVGVTALCSRCPVWCGPDIQVAQPASTCSQGDLFLGGNGSEHIGQVGTVFFSGQQLPNSTKLGFYSKEAKNSMIQ